MGVRLYKKNEHQTGWIGFRVTVSYGDVNHQTYFSTKNCAFQDDRCLLFKRQRLRAELQNAEWLAESALHQYKRFVTENHPTTREGRGLGFQGMTMGYGIDRRGKSQAMFIVHWWDESNPSRSSRRSKEFTFRTKPFSQVWREAVHYWAKAHEILPEDRERILQNPPDPSAFTRLRRILNAEGADIPLEALGPVFREQRATLKEKRLLASTGEKRLSAGAPVSISNDVESEIATWFASETSGA